jgi:hypothetical protein
VRPRNVRDFVGAYAARKAVKEPLLAAVPRYVPVTLGLLVGGWIMVRGLNWQVKHERMKRIEDKVDRLVAEKGG